MDDKIILANLFKNLNDEIHFKLFKESNIVELNNKNKGSFSRETNFNTQSLARQVVNYKDAYILIEIQIDIPFDDTDQGKKAFLN